MGMHGLNFVGRHFCGALQNFQNQTNIHYMCVWQCVCVACVVYGKNKKINLVSAHANFGALLRVEQRQTCWLFARAATIK